ncbi:unnamed protein product [Moneuplotes crassus]|uniref:SKP1 component POZ domain-containing protein n=3 Tax=Euplotidae TaxID=100127 RepID=A0AAD1Y1C3_EUPCR|nr:hypothetical protein [Euplotes vannus]CAI2382874.1 unnamed protein product [Moneuplotes crassus]
MSIKLICKDGEIMADERLATVSKKVSLSDGEVELKTADLENMKWILEYFDRRQYELPDVLEKPLRSNMINDLYDDEEDQIQFLPLHVKRDILNIFDELEIWNCVELFCAAIASDFRRKDLADIREEYGQYSTREFDYSFRREDEDRIKTEFPWILESHNVKYDQVAKKI